eukprot:CAMPEP_0194270546 /NCGR_PEP_ID=MMETSP0169-20130528/4511_1 /TAXON_ID=218684 /ORGANISM="Corethron pennatum, Strain L29A3" /LENGTH=534 /DNA_ID=CAMNT_0039012633 /DNA_START=219 /DNA_END=1823 /DNA_ORIENTATION=-
MDHRSQNGKQQGRAKAPTKGSQNFVCLLVVLSCFVMFVMLSFNIPIPSSDDATVVSQINEAAETFALPPKTSYRESVTVGIDVDAKNPPPFLIASADNNPLSPLPDVVKETNTRGTQIKWNSIASVESRGTKINFDEIATKWELPDGGIDLLKEIQARPVAFDYNKTTDILSLRHPLKTGGTSLSRMLDEIFGGSVVPGSGPSAWFNYEKYKKALEEHPPSTEGYSYWNKIGVLYTHTLLRPNKKVKENGGGYLLERLRKDVPVFREKRFRLMTIVRRPLDLAASNFYEQLCKVGRFANQYGGGKPVSECPPVNLTDVKHKLMEHASNKCDENPGERQGRRRQGRRCKQIKEIGADKVFEHCGSLDIYLEKDLNHNMHHSTLMGVFPRPPELEDNSALFEVNLTPTLKDVSLYTLRDLGGLVDYHETYKEDFVWFAVTERFKESMCLFYYRFEIEHVKEKHSLYKPCRPLNFWEDKHKKILVERESFDYTVWRAANAILDVRMDDMKLEIRSRLDAGEKLEKIPYLAPGCYVEN